MSHFCYESSPAPKVFHDAATHQNRKDLMAEIRGEDEGRGYTM
jgi:hypothetical protein